MDEQRNIQVSGTCPNPPYGQSAVMSLHIVTHYYEDGDLTKEQIIPGNAPYTVHIKIDGAAYKTITDIPACVDAHNENEYNCIVTGIPCGVLDLVVEDSSTPEPLDARCHSMWTVQSPPFGTMNGEVNPGGLDTTVRFEFGTTTDYGREAEYGVVPAGHDVVHVSKRLKSKKEGSNDPTDFLEPGTTYHYRMVASNSLGEVTFEDMTFDTPSYQSMPTGHTLPATDIS